MTCDEYRELRKYIGKQKDVAKMLGVTPEALCRREKGNSKIVMEAELAMRFLVALKRNGTCYNALPPHH